MKQNILISVLIPTFNVEKFINQAIECIRVQSYSNFEIIVVDDCSTDQTYMILDDIKLSEPRLKLYRNEQNLGIVKTLNFALSKSKGDYIVRMDGDDLCHPLKFEKQLEFLLDNPDISLVGCDVYSIDENGRVLNEVKTAKTVECTKKLLKYVSPVLHIWMCKKEIYTILGGYRELGGSEDYDFLLRLDTMGYSFCNISFYGYSVRIRSGNTQTTRGLYQRKIVFYLRKLYRERLEDNSDSFNLKSRDKMTNSNFIFEKLHRASVKYTYEAMKCRSDKRYFMFLFYVIASMVSPFQIQSHFDNLMAKYYLYKFNRNQKEYI
ncbi:glycosyltransferase involved in cell wall biosynthesis [Flavobacterium sp. 103]|uniref:glycosyltransferase family 2 protein n=1 Tax=Flavobacterium sp. 103 TaxID=2135624 RepID=UPI000D5DB615|nr:glycosyltransferase family 2 protein [Flavobacterium sp. 103]PVX46593.1 glycosyltransferase involved in cell wall biosynthesis [Flavobacterium sp. 103]